MALPAILYLYIGKNITKVAICSLLNIDEELPDWVGNPFGVYDDPIRINFSAKRLKRKAGTTDRVRAKADSPNTRDGIWSIQLPVSGATYRISNLV